MLRDDMRVGVGPGGGVAGAEMLPHVLGHGHSGPQHGWTGYPHPSMAEVKEADIAMQISLAAQVDDMLKLFVGQIPKDMEEDALRPCFEAYGPIFEITVIRDKSTRAHRGCAFITYCQRQSALDAINALHDKVRLGNAVNCLQVRAAESQSNDSGVRTSPAQGMFTDPYATFAERENKLFIGMLPKTMNESHLQEMFARFGEIREVHIIRNLEGLSKGAGFVKFVNRESAIEAINAVHDTVPDGSTRALVVKFADNKKQPRKNTIPPTVPSAASPFGRGGTPQGPENWVYNSGYPYTLQAAHLSQQIVPSYMQYAPSPQLAPTYPLYYPQTPFFSPYGHPMAVGSPQSQQSPSVPTLGVTDATSQPQTPGSTVDSPSHAMEMQLPAQMQPTTHTPTTRPAEGPVGANLFIYHLPQGLTDADLATLFSNFGNVISAKVFVDKQTAESKGFGFVSYDSVPAADTAIQVMNGFQIGNKRLKVQHKKERVGGAGEPAAFLSDQLSLNMNMPAGYFENDADSHDGVGVGIMGATSLGRSHMQTYMRNDEGDLSQQFGTLRLDA